MSKKKTKKSSQPAVNTISHCNFVGAQYDAQAVLAISTIAEVLVETAKALGKLAEVLKASNVTIETMLSFKAAELEEEKAGLLAWAQKKRLLLATPEGKDKRYVLDLNDLQKYLGF